MLSRVAVLAASLVLLASCGSSSDDEPKAAPKPAAAATTEAAPAFDAKAYATKIEASFDAQMAGRKISDMCDAAFTDWSCFYDGIEAKSPERVDILLTTDGDITKGEADQLGEDAGLHWFNFVGADNKKLTTIVTFVNGTDVGTTNRDDVPLLNQ